MRKFFILTFIFISSFSLFSEEKYDFRKVRWDMSFDEVLKSEETKPINSCEYWSITYSDQIHNKDVEVVYFFSECKLSSIRIRYKNIFDLDYNIIIKEYGTLRSYYIQKYGKDSLDQTGWNNGKSQKFYDRSNKNLKNIAHEEIYDKWILNNTIISAGIFADYRIGSFNLIVNYEKLKGSIK